MITFFKNKLQHKFNNQYFRHVFTLAVGTTLAQAIPVVISPILTRIYSPDDYALFSLYLAIASVFSVIGTARYEVAVILPESSDDGLSIAILSIGIAFIVAFLTLIVVVIFNTQISSLFNNSKLKTWLYLVPLSVFATSTYRVLINMTNRGVQYKRISVSKVLQTSATGVANLGGGLINATGGCLIIGEIIGHSVAAMFLYIKMQLDGFTIKHITTQQIKHNAKRYSHFPKFNTIHALIDMLQSSGIIFLISFFFGNISLGLYALTMRVLTAPVGVIGSSISQVLYQKASRAYNDGEDIYNLLIGTTKKLAVVSLPCFLILMLFSPDLFSFVFGAKWREAGTFAQILIPWLSLHFIVMPVTQIPLIFGKQKIAFIYGFIGNISMLLAVVFGGYSKDIQLGLMLLSGYMVVHLSIYFLWIMSLAKKHSLKFKPCQGT